MSDNTTLDTGSGGDTIRTEDRGSFKTPVSLIDVGGTSGESIIGDSGVAMPVGGLSAENGAVEGNPVLVGGRYDSSARTLGDGDVGALALTTAGFVIISDGGGNISIDDGGNVITVDGTVAATQSGAWSITDISGTVSLPTGASTAAKQPALGTAGSASADVLTVQGIASMVALKVDGSAVTQPISAASLPLPSGASTALLQTAGNAHLSNIFTLLETELEPYIIASSTSLGVIDDWDESDRAKVNLIVGQAGIASGAGVVGATVPRVTLASDDPAVALLTTIDADTSTLAGTVSSGEVTIRFAAESADGVNTEEVTSGGNWSTNTWTGDGEQNEYAYVCVVLQVDETGTLYLDFSLDGSNWSSFPTNGFSVASGINEIHAGVKAGRYFRPRFVGTGGRTYFRLHTYYSHSPFLLNAPLNQTLGSDSDALTTRAVLVGAKDDGNYINVGVTDSGGLKVGQDAEVDENNSTTTPLSGNADFTGTATDVRGYGGITVSIYADQDSDANGMRFEFSTDATNWDINEGGGFDYEGSTGRQFQFNVQAQYFRVVFQNGSSSQSVFRLQTLLHKVPPAITTIHRADAALKPDRSATLVKAVLMAQVGGSGDMVPVQASAAGVLKTSGSGGGVTDTAYNEDAAFGNADAGSFVLAVRRDTADSGVNQDGDYASFNVNSEGKLWTTSTVYGAVAHDGVDSGNPVKVGAKAIAHGSNPTAVAAGDRTDLYANRHGQLWTIAGHPNIVTKEFTFTAGDGAQTSAALVTVSSGTKIAVTKITATCDAANTADVGVRVGFAAATLTAAATSGITGIVLSHPGIAYGGGIVEGDGSAVIGVGADGEDLRITSEAATGGSLVVTVSYFTIES